MELINFTLPFLESLSSLIFEEQKHLSPDFSKILLVFPSKRSSLYFRRIFLKTCGTDAIYLPKMTTTENLFSEIYAENFSKKKAGTLKRIFLLKKSLLICQPRLSTIFKESEDKVLENYFDFIGYGNKLLKFFDELIVDNVSFDNLKKEVLYTDYELQIEILFEILSSYSRLLEESGYIDEQNILKELVCNFSENWFTPYEYIYLCGFFTLNKLETDFFKKVTKLGKTKTILHSKPEEIFLESGNPAFQHHKKIIKNIKADFFSENHLKHHKKPVEKTHELLIKELKSNFEQVSFIVESIGKNLSRGIRPEKIAVILPNENLSTLITPVFENYGISYNLTVGHPFRETALSGFINFLNNLLAGNFYYKDVMAFLNHPFIKNAKFDKTTAEGFCYSLIRNIKKNNLIYIEPGTENFIRAFSKESHQEFYSSCSEGISGLLKQIREGFQKSKEISDLILFIQDITKKILSLSGKKEHDNHPFLMQGIEKIYSVSEEFYSISSDYGDFISNEDKKSFLEFFVNELEKQHITISGTPFSGIQVMGVLEARNLNFDAVIIPSMNEGFFPKENPKDLFLNSNIRKKCGLPTYKERESLFGLYFEQITGCAKFTSISYIKEEADSPSLPSRFLESELFLSKHPGARQRWQETYHFPYSKGQTSYPSQNIKKTDETIKEIQKIKLSASSLKDYIECRARFYFKYILHLREDETIVEEFGALERGAFIHEALKEFIPLLFDSGNNLSENELYNILCDEFGKAFNEVGTQNYADILMLKTAKRRFLRFINNEVKRRDEGFRTCAANLELAGETKFSIDEKRAVTLTGRIDRVDEKDGMFFLIDYKTGKPPSERAITKFENEISDLQLCIYAFLFCSIRNIPEERIGGLGYYDLKENFNIKPQIVENKLAEYLQNSRAYIKGIISEILDKDRPFSVAEDVRKCEYCIYPDICRVTELSETSK